MSVVRQESRRLFIFGDHHRRLLFRLFLVIAATAIVDLCGSVAMYFLERHAHATEVKTFGQALFFTTVQLLTVSSSLRNPVTPGARGVDVVLELWAVLVVAGSAGAFAGFFQDARANR